MEHIMRIPVTSVENNTVGINTHKGYFIIAFERINYCKADGSYAIIFLDDGSEIVISKSLAAIEKILGDKYFIRCHNSYLVNAKKVNKFNRKLKILNILDQNVPVSRRRCSCTLAKLRSLSDQL